MSVEAAVAYTSARAGAELNAEALHELCNEELAKYKRPVLIEVLEELPKNAVGKIDKPALRQATASTSG
jgi:acyl-CoA synthetase (AMP-forming)/AMP-acid ligase II